MIFKNLIILLVFLNSAYASGKFASKVSIQTTSTIGAAKNVEIDFMIKPIYSDNHIIQINYSTDWFFENHEENLNFISGFAIGTGVIFDFESADICALFGLINQTGYLEGFPKGFTHESFYFDLNPKIKLGNFYWTFSGKVYLNDVFISKKYQSYTLQLGLGINLF